VQFILCYPLFLKFFSFSPTMMKSVNLEGRIHRTPTVDTFKVVVPTKAIVKWVSFWCEWVWFSLIILGFFLLFRIVVIMNYMLFNFIHLDYQLQPVVVIEKFTFGKSIIIMVIKKIFFFFYELNIKFLISVKFNNLMFLLEIIQQWLL